MQMDAGLDTGDMLLQAALPIAPHHDTATLHDALASLGATLLVDALRRQLAGELVPTVQPTEGVTYAHKIEKQEAAIDWTQPADALRRQVKAFNPFPGATGQWSGSPSGELLKIWDAETVHLPVTGALSHALAGTVVGVSDQGLDIRCGDTPADGQLPVLRLTVLQRAGGKRLPVAVLLNGFTVHIGETFLVSAGEPS
jgi:methionyl-tRNA formyltransferase